VLLYSQIKTSVLLEQQQNQVPTNAGEKPSCADDERRTGLQKIAKEVLSV
jgi:hypothetical protein